MEKKVLNNGKPTKELLKNASEILILFIIQKIRKTTMARKIFHELLDIKLFVNKKENDRIHLKCIAKLNSVITKKQLRKSEIVKMKFTVYTKRKQFFILRESALGLLIWYNSICHKVGGYQE